MENNEFLQAIRTMIQEEVKPLNTRLDSMDKRLDSLENGQQQLKEGLSELKTTVGNIKDQQDENSGFIQALISRTNIIDAKIDGLTISTASKEAVARVDAKLNVLNDRLLDQEADIQLLEKAQ